MDVDTSGEDLSQCPSAVGVDNIIREMASIWECGSNVHCLADEQCCETTDRISVCIPRQSTITTATETTMTTEIAATTTTAKTTVQPDDGDSVAPDGRSEPDKPPAAPSGPEQNQKRNGTISKVGNELVNRRYLLPADWESITFVDTKLRLNNGKIMSYLFYFEDTRAFLDGMFPGMRLQVCWQNFC